jgi:hypothetical protein
MSNKQRAEDDEMLALTNGFSPKPPVFELGTPVNNWGVDNARKSRKNWEELPLAQDDCVSYIDIINSEDRQDISYELNKFRMNEVGAIDGPTMYVPTEFALSSLVQKTRVVSNLRGAQAVVKAASYVSDPYSPLELRQEIVNYYLSTSKKSAWLRSRVHKRSVGRELFGVFSDRYDRSWSVNNILELVRQKLELSDNPARSETTYDGHKFRMSIVYHTAIEPENYVAGEFFQAGVDISLADDGSQSIRLSPFVLRNLCLNLIILDRASQTIELTHLKKDLGKAINEGIDAALHKVEGFAEKWSLAGKESILDGIYDNLDPVKVITKLVKAGYGKIPGLNKDEAAQKIYGAWKKEPGYTKAAMVNAISRAAHENNWTSPWITQSLEESAGELLYNKVYLAYGDTND